MAGLFDDLIEGSKKQDSSSAGGLFDDLTPKPKGLTGHLRDTGLSLAKGVISVPEAAVGLADIPFGGRIGKALENEDGLVGFRPQQAKEFLSEFYTDQYKAQQQAFQEADGVLAKTGVALRNPSLVTNTVVESAPGMMGGGALAQGIRRVAPRVSALAAGAAGEGSVMAGMQASEIRSETDDGLLSPIQSMATVGTGVLGALFGLVGARLAQKLGIGDIDTLLAQGVTRQEVAGELASMPAKSIPRRIIEGAITEGFLEELPQSVSEQIIQNLALDRDWSDGVEDAAVMGTLAGMVMGGGTNLVAGRRRTQANPEQQGEQVDPRIEPATETPGEEDVAAVPEPAVTTAQDMGEPLTAPREDTAAEAAPEASQVDPVRPSERLGLNPDDGPVSTAAALAVDSGAAQQLAEQAALEEATEQASKQPKAKTQADLDPAPEGVNPETGEIIGEQPSAEQRIAELQQTVDYARNQARANGWTQPLLDLRQNAEAELGALGQNQPAQAPAVEAEQPQQQETRQSKQPETVSEPQSAPDISNHAAQWERMTPVQRTSLLVKPGGWPSAKGGLNVIGKRVAATPWADMPEKAKARVAQLINRGNEPSANERPAKAKSQAKVEGKDLGDGWTAFTADSGTKGIPRADMPQIKAEHRGAMVNFMKGRGIEHREETLPAASLKPTQAEFSPEKVAKAKQFDGGNRAILVSSDGHVLDGHHQWMAARDNGDEVRVIRLDAPIETLLTAAGEFPSSTVDDASAGQGADARPKAQTSPIEDLGEKVGGARKDTAQARGKRASTVKADDQRPGWLKRYEVSQIVSEFTAGGTAVVGRRDDARAGRWVVYDKRKKDWRGQPVQATRETFATKEEAEAAMPLIEVARNHAARSVGDGKYEIWRTVSDHKRVKVVDQTFESRDEAIKHMAVHAVQIIEAKTNFGEADLPLPADRARTGPERRQGDVGGQDFMETFGLRAVEFGNWNNQAERQALLNSAYDGLMDLADVLNIPPKAIGLNGDLALAFGARGQGLSSARAHYERARVVMNLTKENGAGSLAHEWFHALDHYLGRQDGKASAEWVVGQDGTRTLKVQTADKDYASSGFRRRGSGVREELSQAYEKLIKTLFRKAETYVEDTVRADDFVGRARKGLQDRLDDLRRNLASEVTYGKRFTKPASADQLAEFDTIAQRLLDGQGLEAEARQIEGSRKRFSYRHTNDSLEALSALFKAVRGRNGFSAEGRGPLDYLRSSMSHYKQRLDMLEQAESGTQKTRQTPTDFAMDARELDQGRGTDYWTTPHEMVARAFQGYVEDQIAERGGISRFLNYGPEDAGILTPWGFKHPFPKGQERQTINQALDGFVKTLKTRETESGVELFSKAAGAGRKRITLQQATSVADGLKRLSVPVEAVKDESSLPESVRRGIERRGWQGRVEGVFYQGKAWLVADNLASVDRAYAVALHEVVGHAGVKAVLGNRLNPIMRQIYRSMPVPERARIQRKYGKQLEEKPKAEAEQTIAEEYVARLAETNPDNTFVQRVVAAIRNFFRQMFPSVKWRTADIVSLLADSRRFVGRQSMLAGDMAYSLTDSTREVYEARIDALFDGADPSQQGVTVLDRSDVLDLLGYGDMAVALAEKHAVSDGRFNHPQFTAADWKKVPDWLENPVAVFKRDDGHLTVIAPETRNGHPIIIGLNPNVELGSSGQSPRPRFHVLLTAYNKDKGRMPLERMVADQLVFIDQRKTPDFNRDAGHRLPSQTADLRGLGRKVHTGADLFKYRSSQAKGDDASFSLSEPDNSLPGRGIASAAMGQRLSKALKGKLADLKPAGLGALPLMYLRDYAPKSMTALDRYMDERRAMDADRNELHAKYDAIAQKWLKQRIGDGVLLDKAKALVGVKPKQVQALDSLMHDATVAGIDPSKPRKPDADRVQYLMLRKRYDSLSPEQQALFGEVRDAYRSQIQLLEETIEQNIVKSVEFAKRRARRDRDAEIEQAQDELVGDELDEAIEAAEKRYAGRVKAAEAGSSARVLLLRQKFENMRVDEPYFPLKRFGDYFVAVRDGDKLLSFSMFESAAAMQDAAEQLQRLHPGMTVKVGRKSIKQDLRGAVDAAFVSDIQELVARLPNAAEISDQVYQLYLETLPDFSMRKGFIHRKKVEGYSDDAMRAFASSMFHSSHQIARLKHSLEMNELVDIVEEQAKEARDPVDAMTVANELRRRHEWVMNPQGSKLAQAITSAAFVYQLGISPAAAFVNTTQTFMMGVPILGSRFKSERKATSELLKASKDFIAGRGHLDKTLKGQEKEAFDEFMRMGLIDKTQAHDLAGVGETGVEYSAVRHKVMGFISYLFHNAERYNREVTSMAAYRMARNAGRDHEAAIKEAAELTWMTHFDYSSGNRARYMQSDTAKVLLVFRQHSVNMLARLAIDARQALKGESPDVRAEARRRLAGMYGIFALMAGMLGVPGAQAVLMLLNALGGDDDPWTTEDKIRRSVTEALGEDLAAAFFHGVPGTLADLNLTDRIGMGHLWFFSPNRELEGRDAYVYWMEQVLGAAPAMVANTFSGASMMGEGHVMRGFETMLPKAGKDILRAVRYSNEGVQSLNGYSVVDDVGAWGVISQAMGFLPAHVAEQYERNSALKNAEQRILNERRSLMNRYALAVRTADTEGRSKAQERIADFNRRYPAVRITNGAIIRSLRSRENTRDRAGGGVLIDKRLEYLRREQQPVM